MFTGIKKTALLLLMCMSTQCVQAHLKAQLKENQTRHILYDPSNNKQTTRILIADTGQVYNAKNFEVIANKVHISSTYPDDKTILGYYYKKNDTKIKYYVYK